MAEISAISAPLIQNSTCPKTFSDQKIFVNFWTCWILYNRRGNGRNFCQNHVFSHTWQLIEQCLYVLAADSSFWGEINIGTPGAFHILYFRMCILVGHVGFCIRSAKMAEISAKILFSRFLMLGLHF